MKTSEFDNYEDRKNPIIRRLKALK